MVEDTTNFTELPSTTSGKLTAPEMEDLLEASRFAFYQLTSARRALAIDKMKIIGAASGVEELYKEIDEHKKHQNREIIDEKEYAAIETALKKRKAFVRLVNDKPGQVFARGRSGGRGSSRGSRFGRSVQSNPRAPSHQGYQARAPRGQYSRGRGGWSSRGRQAYTQQPHQTQSHRQSTQPQQQLQTHTNKRQPVQGL